MSVKKSSIVLHVSSKHMNSRQWLTTETTAVMPKPNSLNDFVFPSSREDMESTFVSKVPFKNTYMGGYVFVCLMECGNDLGRQEEELQITVDNHHLQRYISLQQEKILWIVCLFQ